MRSFSSRIHWVEKPVGNSRTSLQKKHVVVSVQSQLLLAYNGKALSRFYVSSCSNGHREASPAVIYEKFGRFKLDVLQLELRFRKAKMYNNDKVSNRPWIDLGLEPLYFNTTVSTIKQGAFLIIQLTQCRGTSRLSLDVILFTINLH